MKITLTQILRLSLFGIIIPLMIGCSKNLSRDEAAKQIKSTYQLPKDEFKEFNSRIDVGRIIEYQWTSGEVNYEGNTRRSKPELFSNLENEGLIIANEVKETYEVYPDLYKRFTRYRNRFYYEAKFTDKATPYVSGNYVKVATLEFGEVTGIIERKEFNVSEVNYTERRTNITPFGNAYGLYEETFNKTASFTKYDDGWRINQ